MTSNKTVIPLEDIVRPFAVVPDDDWQGGVNSVMFHYRKGIPVSLNYPEWEVLFFAGLIKLGGDMNGK